MSSPRLTYLEIVKTNDDFPYEESARASYYALYLPDDKTPHGYLLPSTVAAMPWTADFQINSTPPLSVTVLDSSKGKDTAAAVNRAFQSVIDKCVDDNLFHILDGQHSELVTIIGANLPIRLERFASALFGIVTRGAHLIAYTRSRPSSSSPPPLTSSSVVDEELKLWIPRRSPHLYTAPGKLDSTVAGGIKAGTTPFRTIVEEAMEEASLPREYVEAHVRARGVVTTMSVTGSEFPGEKGLVVPNVDFVYDMELPASGEMVPRPQDEEVDSFRCLTMEEVKEALLRGEFKESSAAIMVDFLVRQGIITDENEGDYVEIVGRLHRRLPFRIKPE